MRHVLPCLACLVACTPTVPDDKVDTDATDVATDTPVLPTDSDAETDVDTDRVWSFETDTADTGGPVATSVLRPGGVRICLHPEDREDGRFGIVTVAIPEPPLDNLLGGGVTVGDFDGNGLLDVFAATHQRPTVWTQGPVGSFTRTVLFRDDTATAKFGYFGAAAADYDGNGTLDVVVTGQGIPTRLYANDGSATFTDVTALSGLGTLPAGYHAGSATWHDVDADGDLDLFLAGYGQVDDTVSVLQQGTADASYLFLNLGDGTFVDGSDRIPAAAQTGWTVTGTFFDADSDGDDDLFLLNDFGNRLEPSHLLWNEGGVFSLDDGSAGLNLAINGHGVAVADVDHDGDEDLFVTSVSGYRWLVNQQGVFTDQATAAGIAPLATEGSVFGADAGDLDNDGRVDFTISRGRFDSPRITEQPDAQPDELLLQGAPVAFTHAAADWSTAQPASTRVGLLADLNRDGWLDIVKPSLDGTGGIFLSRCGEQSWLRVGLRQDGPNTFGIGATVRVTSDGVTQTRRLRAGGHGWGSGGPPEVHFGLGTTRRITALEVIWPDGHVDAYGPRLARQALLVDRRGTP